MPSFSRKKTYSLHHGTETTPLNGTSSHLVSGPLLSLSSRNRAKALAKKKVVHVGRGSVRYKKGERFKSKKDVANGSTQPLLTSDFQQITPIQPLPGEAELNDLFVRMVVRKDSTSI